MIICFNCSPETKRFLDDLVKSGQYEDYAEAISFALANLVALHKEIGTKGAIVIKADSGKMETEALRSMKPKKGPSGRVTKRRQRSKATRVDQRRVTVESIPEIFLMIGLDAPPSTLAPLPDDIWAKGQEVPLDRWLFGQYNKLLPAKASCRALAHLLTDYPQGILLSEAAAEISHEAALLGDFLRNYDMQNGLGRDDALSTGFPSSGLNTEKSRLRYAGQFVGSVNQNGQVSGLLIGLKLVNYSSEKNSCLFLTEAGWRFAIAKNPILDNAVQKSKDRFSNAEVSFLINHIKENVPAEDFAYRAVLSAINDGANNPNTLDEELRRYVSHDRVNDFRNSFLSSQRSGAVSRMTDLGLVSRVRTGVRVSYVLTERGQNYMGNGK